MIVHKGRRVGEVRNIGVGGAGSDLLGSAPAPPPGKKRRLQAAPAPYNKNFHFKLSKS